MMVLPRYERPPASATAASDWLDCGITSVFAPVVNFLVGLKICGASAQPEFTLYPGATPVTSIESLLASAPLLSFSRPKIGEPQMSTLSSLVCSGPLIESPVGNWISTQTPSFARAVRFFSTHLDCWVVRSLCV